VILIDSSVWIDYFRGRASPQTDRLDALLDAETVATGDLILAEVLQGFGADRDFRQAKILMSAFPVLDLGGREIAVAAAQNFRALRARGVTTRKTIDTIIATYCIAHRLPLLFSDRDFEPFVEYLGLQSALSGGDVPH
jgi:predicted nucleic acid-binding protein